MFAKIALAGATAAAIIGVGTAAIATSGPSATAGSGTTGSQHAAAKGGAKGKAQQGKHPLRRALRHAVHGSVVTKGKDGYVTHTAVRGTVTSVSSTALTVKAADGFSQTYTLTKTTRVRERAADGKKATKGALSDLKTGDKVGVVGTAPDKAGARPTAQFVLDGLTK